MKTTEPPVSVEYIYPGSLAQVWSALTSQEEMIQWFFDNIPAFKAEVGFETNFPVSSGERTFTHLWKITEVITNQRIAYNWKYEEYAGEADAIFELFDEDDEVRVRLTMKVLEDFPDCIPEFSRESCIEGWEYFLGGNLMNYLNERTND